MAEQDIVEELSRYIDGTDAGTVEIPRVVLMRVAALIARLRAGAEKRRPKPVAWRWHWKTGSDRDREWEMWTYGHQPPLDPYLKVIEPLFAASPAPTSPPADPDVGLPTAEDVRGILGPAPSPPAGNVDELRKALELTPIHLKLLRRGENGRWIGLSDDMMFRIGEVVALGELHRAGYVEYAKGPFPPGPPSLTPEVITEAGREALWKVIGRPVPPHGSGP